MNAEQIRYWNEAAGPKWVAFQDFLDRQIAPLGQRAMEAAGIAAGERVVDVGCGCGQTTIELARRVGPTGAVLGLDVSAPMLARAAERALGIPNVGFENADAQTHRLAAGAFDVVYSRFGVMFFADPVAAFANLRTALRPGGRLAFVCWQPLVENAWAHVPLQAAARHVTLPPPPAPDAPGPFAFADAGRVRGILSRAGFEQIACEDRRETLSVAGGAPAREAVTLLLGMGPTGAALREADPELLTRVAASVLAAVKPYETAEGLRMGSAAWIVSAVSMAR